THVNYGHAESDLVLHETREPGGVGADDEGVDLEMRAPDRRAVIAYAGRARSHHMHVDAEPFAKHSARVADAPAIVNREPDRHRMDHVPIARLAHQVTLLEHALDLGIRYLAPGNADLGLDNARAEKPARQVRHDLLDRLARHFFGGVHRIDDRGACRFQVDNRSVPHAARDLMADTEDPRLVGCHLGDEAANLGRADIECSNQATARPDRRPTRLRLP